MANFFESGDIVEVINKAYQNIRDCGYVSMVDKSYVVCNNHTYTFDDFDVRLVEKKNSKPTEPEFGFLKGDIVTITITETGEKLPNEYVEFDTMDAIYIQGKKYPRSKYSFRLVARNIKNEKKTSPKPVLKYEIECTNTPCPWNLKESCMILNICPGQRR